MSENGRQRLTSWKEIAAHLGRDVRTVLRWEKERGLPVRRVPGATGRVVFAYTDELDAWAHGELESPAAPSGLAEPPSLPEAGAPPALTAAAPRKRPPQSVMFSLVVVAGLSAAAWQAYASRGNEGLASVRVTDRAIVGVGPGGNDRWRYELPEGVRIDLNRYQAGQPSAAEIVRGADPGVLAANSLRSDEAAGSLSSGLLFWLSLDGTLRRALTLDDRPRFGRETFTSSWSLTDFRVDLSQGARRVAASAHHFQWWPSIVTLYDDQWNRKQTFVHAGWVERLQWLSANRLLVAGFSNPYDGGFVALLDPSSLDGQGPVPAGSRFDCTSCGRARPVRYVVMPRSEVNVAGGMPFNRVVIDASDGRLVARTIEGLHTDGRAADALYEFTPDLEPVRAWYSDRYWEEHRLLEAAGKIKHTVAACPDRDGPRAVRVWEPQTGWRTVNPRGIVN